MRDDLGPVNLVQRNIPLPYHFRVAGDVDLQVPCVTDFSCALLACLSDGVFMSDEYYSTGVAPDG